MPGKEKPIPTILIVASSYSVLTGAAADKLSQVYRVRIAETQDTALGYLRCMKFDLVVIEDGLSKDIVPAITEAAPPETTTYFPRQSVKTQTIVSEITRRLESK